MIYDDRNHQNPLQQLIADSKILQDRKKLIEDLRELYFDALRQEDALSRENRDARLQVLSKAQDAGVELFSDVPLSQIQEIEALNKLSEELESHKEILFGAGVAAGVVAGGLLGRLRNFDVEELSTKLEKLKEITGETESVVKRTQELERQLDQLVLLLNERRRQVVLVSTLDKLLALRMMSPEKYDAKSERLLQGLDSEIVQLGDLDEKTRSQTVRLIDEAERDREIWEKLSTEEKTLLQRIDQTLKNGQEVSDADKDALEKIKNEHPLVIRLRTRIMQQTGMGITITSAAHQKLAEQTGQWWRYWHNIGKTQSPAKKGEWLDFIYKKIMSSSKNLNSDSLSDPLIQEVLLAWQRRIDQAKAMNKFILGVRQILPKPGSTTDKHEGIEEEHGRFILDQMHNFVRASDPEVFWLFYKPYKTLFEDVMKATLMRDVDFGNGTNTMWDVMESNRGIVLDAMKTKAEDGERWTNSFLPQENPKTPMQSQSISQNW